MLIYRNQNKNETSIYSINDNLFCKKFALIKGIFYELENNKMCRVQSREEVNKW